MRINCKYRCWKVALYDRNSPPKASFQKEVYVDGFTPYKLEESYNIEFDTLIMDIEGGEFEFIKTYTSWLSKLNMLLIEFHSNQLAAEQDFTDYFKILEEGCDFSLAESLNGSHVFMKK